MIKEQGKKTVLDDFSACHRFDRRNDISKINAPCLIICGEEDKMTPPSLSRKLEGHIGKSRLVIISSSGHMGMMEKPDEFNKHILGFAQEAAINPD